MEQESVQGDVNPAFIEERLSHITAMEPKPINRVTVIEQVYHQVDGLEPQLIDSKFNRELTSTEQVYQRETKISTEWKLVDTGWVLEESGISFIVIKNTEGGKVFPTVNDAQQKKSESKFIYVSYDKDKEKSFIIRPKESLRFCPSDVENLYIVGEHPDTPIKITAIPD